MMVSRRVRHRVVSGERVMNLAALISLGLKVSIVLLVFGLGLRVNAQDTIYLLRRTGLLWRSLLAMNVVMPLVAVALVAAFDLHPAVKLALVALSVSPVPDRKSVV